MQICIFEDIHYEFLEPLIFTRPTCDLVCGISTLREKILRNYPGVKYSLHCRQHMEAYLKERNPDIPINRIDDDDCLLINGRVLASSNFAQQIPVEQSENKVYKQNDVIVAARISGDKLKYMKTKLTDLFSETDFDGLPVENVEVKIINYVWNLIQDHPSEFINDYNYFISGHKDKILGVVHEGVHFIEKDNVFIDEGAVIKPGSVFDASRGPIYISKNAMVFPNAVVEGPVFLGEASQIKSCAYVYDNVSIGRVCKVGGEVEHSIILPYTNKQHSGFIGHAYFGSWVNIGADTNCSDLKNNYGSVRMYINGDAIDTGCQFLGVVIGDHTKVAINTMFNTGTVIGYACNVIGAGFPPKNFPSFSWGGAGSVTTYDLERCIETARRAMVRRSYTMSESEEIVFRKTFDLTRKVRRRLGYPY
jgi:UDP-N-acetylglucosamine diphosphorylase / glucose-1-phosphate thymidylyltransferase / UDP-N-acetylgalactosamine diphosphorylase / glucosamine-1-phosphate N-acetyltransferase / galactosamine-1-phosphate N-acetyltransferase